MITSDLQVGEEVLLEGLLIDLLKAAHVGVVPLQLGHDQLLAVLGLEIRRRAVVEEDLWTLQIPLIANN